MWSYMMSFYVEAPAETRRRRLPYILTSLIIMILSTTASIVHGLATYDRMLKVTPGTENIEANKAVLDASYDKFGKVISFLWDIAFRFGDAVLVGVFALC